MTLDPVRKRFSADARRRQLIAIGLTKLMETPIQDLSLDAIATEAGISRGLLFHYFPTKTDFYVACIAAAGRRILRTTAPDEGDTGEVQVTTMLHRMVEQIDRRRAFYETLVHGVPEIASVHESVREVTTDRVMAALGLPPAQRRVVRAWWAYVEDYSLTWSAVPQDRRTDDLDAAVAHCRAALDALLAV